MKDYTQTYTITPEDVGKRLDVVVTEFLGVTRSQVKKMIKYDEILVDNALPRKSGDTMKEASVISFQEREATPVELDDSGAEVEKPVPTVLAETKEYLVINKPSNLLTHPTEANEPWSVTAWVLENYPKLKGVGEYDNRPGIVHRLDKDTSGIMVIAKTQDMFAHLKSQFKDRTIDKRYVTLVHGLIEPEHDTIDFDIDRGHDGRMVARPKMDILKLSNVGKEQNGKMAKTEFWVRKRFARYSLLDVKIHTGRTHQIRVHLFAYNKPVVGDPLYTNVKINRKLDKELNRLFLHAASLSFTDLAGETVSVEAPLPEVLTTVLNTIS